ncbi:hypothetical protein HZB97_03270 [Candidatus Gottesmanbacteria bacterium]|nr:hypothetical protein [Candidatus Gottesmanbacteria bacterium]
MSDSSCPIYQDYEEEAGKITAELNRSQNLQAKAEFAQRLINLEAKLAPCEENDDPKCRIQRRSVVPLRRKTAETILKLWQAKKS